jgi:hypothetical protein
VQTQGQGCPPGRAPTRWVDVGEWVDRPILRSASEIGHSLDSAEANSGIVWPHLTGGEVPHGSPGLHSRTKRASAARAARADSFQELSSENRTSEQREGSCAHRQCFRRGLAPGLRPRRHGIGCPAAATGTPISRTYMVESHELIEVSRFEDGSVKYSPTGFMVFSTPAMATATAAADRQ